MTRTRPRSSPLVLLVDDSSDNREMYAEYLEFAGLGVAEAADGKQAIDTAVRLLPDLIVMDLALPVIDGWHAIASLRRDHRTSRIPIIALTAYSLSELKRAATSGADLLLTRPCLPSDLVDRIRQLLRARAA